MHIASLLRSTAVRASALGHNSPALPRIVTARFGDAWWRPCATRAAVDLTASGDKFVRQRDESAKSESPNSSQSSPISGPDPLSRSESVSPDAPISSPSANFSTANALKDSTTAAKVPTGSTVKNQPGERIPDVPASSLGLWEEQDAKDPNKWKKFAWKYAGAVILFLISYKTLHWYVDRMEAEGKRQREELEVKKKVSEELHASQKRLPIFDGPSPASVPSSERLPAAAALSPSPIISTISENAVSAEEPAAQSETAQLPKELLDKFAAPLPQTSSELDELYAYRKELEAQIGVYMGETASTHEQGTGGIEELKEELASLAEEIQLLEKKKKKMR